jgi:glycosyltransferase involved in cell wall biosynthesis
LKKVCFFNSIRFWGGGEKLLLEHALYFHQRGYEVTLACHSQSPLAQKAESHSIPTFSLNAGSLSFLNPYKLWRLASYFKKSNTDTVIFTASHDAKLGGIAAKLAGVKRIVYLRGLAVPVKSNIINRFLFGNILTHIVANSQETKRTILKHLSGTISESQIQVIYHGIDFTTSQVTKQPAIANHSKGIVLGNAGRLTTQKGQQYLIEIARILKERNIEFTLFIAGTGELQNELAERIAAHGLENEVKLLGFVENMEQFMQSIDIFLLSSAWEGFGFVIVEAMAHKKPVIAFDVSSNPEIIANHETGFLIPFADTTQFADCIEKIISDPKMRMDMGENGYQRAKALFDTDKQMAAFETYLIS